MHDHDSNLCVRLGLGRRINLGQLNVLSDDREAIRESRKRVQELRADLGCVRVLVDGVAGLVALPHEALGFGRNDRRVVQGRLLRIGSARS